MSNCQYSSPENFLSLHGIRTRAMEQKTLKNAFKMATYIGAFPSFQNKTFKLNKHSVLIVLSIRLLCGFYGFGLRFNKVVSTGGKKYMYDLLIAFQDTAGYLLTIYLFVYQCLDRHSFKMLNSQFIELDRMFIRLNPGKIDRIDYFNHYVLIGMLMFQFSIRIIDFHDYGSNQNIFSIYLMCMVIGSIHPFMLALTNLQLRFVNLRKSLLFHCNFSTLNNRYNKIKRLEEILHLFDLLCSSCKTLNSCFSKPLLNFFSITILVIVQNLHDIILATCELKFTRRILIKALVSVNFSFLAWIITTLCQNILNEVEEFNSLLYQVMIDDMTNDIATNKKLQLHVTLKREVRFTACGFFSIDYTLVHSIIVAVTTYLVILIQFNGSTISETILPNKTSSANSTISM